MLKKKAQYFNPNCNLTSYGTKCAPKRRCLVVLMSLTSAEEPLRLAEQSQVAGRPRARSSTSLFLPIFSLAGPMQTAVLRQSSNCFTAVLFPPFKLLITNHDLKTLNWKFQNKQCVSFKLHAFLSSLT